MEMYPLSGMDVAPIEVTCLTGRNVVRMHTIRGCQSRPIFIIIRPPLRRAHSSVG